MSYAHTVGDPSELVNKLRAQVTAVRESVQHAFDQPLSTCLVELEKSDAAARVHDPNAPLEGRLTAAKVLVSAAYVYLDAIWMCLKAKGVDPATHPVEGELHRVNTYFAKLKEAGSGSSALRIDKPAAERMIAAARDTPRGTHTRFDETPKRKAEESTENASKLAASEPKPKSKKLSKGSKGSKIQSAKRNS